MSARCRWIPRSSASCEAIDRALAGEPVDPDLEALAELARALREERVGRGARLRGRARPAGRGRDSRAAAPDRLAELRERLTAVPPRRILAPAGAAATLLVVVGVAISQSGEIWGGGDGGDTFSAQPAPDSATQAPQRGGARGAGGAAR